MDKKEKDNNKTHRPPSPMGHDQMGPPPRGPDGHMPPPHGEGIENHPPRHPHHRGRPRDHHHHGDHPPGPGFNYGFPPIEGRSHPRGKRRPPARHPFPFKKNHMHKLQGMFLLYIIERYKEGITAYDLEKEFKFPRTSALRFLEKMEKTGILSSKIETEGGRERKFYIITEKGNVELDRMKSKWAQRFIVWSEMIPPPRRAGPFGIEGIKGKLTDFSQVIEDKEQAIDMIRGMRGELEVVIKRNVERGKSLSETKDKIGKLLEFIDSMPEFSIDELLKKFDEI